MNFWICLVIVVDNSSLKEANKQLIVFMFNIQFVCQSILLYYQWIAKVLSHSWLCMI